jgi:hypothetical protein
MPLRALGLNGGSNYDVLQAVRYAAGLANDSGRLPARPASVINLSLGSPFFSQATQDTFTEVRNRGIIVVASAGNESSSEPNYPAAYNGVVSVSATTISGSLAPYSNFGAVDVAAPGGFNGTDENGDGLTAGDLGLGGVTIFIDLDDSGTFNWVDAGEMNGVWDAGEGDQWTQTAGDGSWSFTGLDYTVDGKSVYEVLPSGYVQTLGQAGYVIDGSSGGGSSRPSCVNVRATSPRPTSSPSRTVGRFSDCVSARTSVTGPRSCLSKFCGFQWSPLGSLRSIGSSARNDTGVKRPVSSAAR